MSIKFGKKEKWWELKEFYIVNQWTYLKNWNKISRERKI